MSKFEGQVTPNEDEYQRSVRLKFRYCFGLHAYRGGGDRLWNQPFLQLSDLRVVSDLELNLVSGYTA